MSGNAEVIDGLKITLVTVMRLDTAARRAGKTAENDPVSLAPEIAHLLSNDLADPEIDEAYRLLLQLPTIARELYAAFTLGFEYAAFMRLPLEVRQKELAITVTIINEDEGDTT